MVFVTTLAAQAAVVKLLSIGCSSTTSNTLLKAELGMHPPKTSRDVRELKWQYKVKNMPDKRLPVTADRTVVREKITKGRAGTRWDNVVEKLWKDLGRDQEQAVFREVWRVQNGSKRNNRKGKARSAEK